MSILSNTYESELDIHIFIEDAERRYKFHKHNEFRFDSKWSVDAILLRQLSDEHAARINKRLIERIQQETLATMAVPAEIFERH